MAKEEFAKGDRVRSTRNIEFGYTKIPKTSWGTIKDIKKGVFSSSYVILWDKSHAFLTHKGTKDFVLGQVADGGVSKE
jgi:hypothetical protein